MDPFRVLLGAGRVLGPVLRLMGRYRAATVVSLLLAVGWFGVLLAPGRADAQPRLLGHAGRSGMPDPAGTDAYGAFWLPGPIYDTLGPVGHSIGAFVLAGAVLGALTLGAVVLVALRNGGMWHDGAALRGGGDSGSVVPAGGGALGAGVLPTGPDDRIVGAGS